MNAKGLNELNSREGQVLTRGVKTSNHFCLQRHQPSQGRAEGDQICQRLREYAGEKITVKGYMLIEHFGI